MCNSINFYFNSKESEFHHIIFSVFRTSEKSNYVMALLELFLESGAIVSAHADLDIILVLSFNEDEVDSQICVAALDSFDRVTDF